MPAIMIGKMFNVPTPVIKETIQNFKSLAHRLELVAEINQVKYFNDSIATNPYATMMAIKSFPKGSVILLAGGYERNQDFTSKYLEYLIIIRDNDRKKHIYKFKNKEDFCNRLIQEIIHISKNNSLYLKRNKKIEELEKYKNSLISKNEKLDILLENL